MISKQNSFSSHPAISGNVHTHVEVTYSICIVSCLCVCVYSSVMRENCCHLLELGL